MSDFLTDHGVVFALVCAGLAVVYGLTTSRALLPQVEPVLGPDAGRIRDALSQLQMAYAQAAQGGPEGGQPPAEEPKKPEGPGPAQSSGKLWVPGQ